MDRACVILGHVYSHDMWRCMEGSKDIDIGMYLYK